MSWRLAYHVVYIGVLLIARHELTIFLAMLAWVMME